MTTATTAFPTATEALKFMFAGDATFTVVSNKTGARFTYRMTLADGDQANRPVFVSVLTGNDNETSYSYVGYVRPAKGYSYGGNKAKVAASAPSAVAIQWLLAGLLGNKCEATFAQVSIYHEGRCGRCFRKLTVPASIESGYGPECGQKFMPLAA